MGRRRNDIHKAVGYDEKGCGECTEAMADSGAFGGDDAGFGRRFSYRLKRVDGLRFQKRKA